MTKGKFGLSLAAIAVIAFAFAALRQPVPVLLITGFALLAERDEWLGKQTLQSLLLTIAYYLITLVTDWVFGGLARFFGWLEAFKAQDALNQVNNVVGGVIYIVFVVACVFAILRVLRGKDAGLPWISKMAGGDFSAAFTKAPQPSPAQYAPPQPAAQAYVPTAQPEAQTQAESGRFCSSCGASLGGDSAFCTECGAKIE